MRGAVLHEVGKPLVVRDDLELREPGPGEVLVTLRASGVCHSDLSLQNGTLTANVPVVLGHEGAGEIAATGPGVTGLKAGDHVILSWIPPCGRCRLCLGGQPQLCTDVRQAQAQAPSPLRSPDGAVNAGLGIGTFAEQTVVPMQAAVPIDRDIPFDIAALVGCGVSCGYCALDCCCTGDLAWRARSRITGRTLSIGSSPASDDPLVTERFG